MKTLITGRCRINSRDVEEILKKLEGRIKQIRFVNELEKLAVAAAGVTLDNAGVGFPIGNADAGLFIGIDDSIEDIKDSYFNNILNDGILGGSPLIFPFTSPNALAAQISIAFDIRGESITFPIKQSCENVLKYTAECIIGQYIRMAVAGGITADKSKTSSEKGRYNAEFFFLRAV